MAAPKQTLANHARYVPLYHFVLFGILVAILVRAAFALARHPNTDTTFGLLTAIALFLLAWFARAFAIAVQDRVIRLEVQLRLQRLAPVLAARMGEMSIGQVVALRFAGDAELPPLVNEVLAGKLVAPIEIKRRVQDWQADTLRA